jgi:uncharacterized membrane protein YeaQ/YmgE (transglycosylase-associated protein family)
VLRLKDLPGMNAIPWFKDLEELSTGEFAFLCLMLLIACLAAGFIIDVIMKDAGFGVAPNGVFALVGACAGIYLRYRLLASFHADDLFLTIGFALGTASLLFAALALVKGRVL